MTVTRKPDRRGEYDISRKTIARGMPGVSRCDLTTRVLNSTISAHAAIGRIGRPAFPAPSVEEGGTSRPNLARNMRRDREAVSGRHCERSEAIQLSCCTMDCFASLAMTFFRQ